MAFDSGQILTVIHFLALGGLALYGLHRLWFLLCWHAHRRSPATHSHRQTWVVRRPSITVQLPLYNERFVAARLLDAAAKLGWPQDRLEIQVLDDSTDDTRGIVQERAAHWSREGICMKVLRRDHRHGFKAGALARGMASASGEFIAIFDADFLPCPDFLLRTVPCFSDPKVGMVQARWGFLNAKHSWLTGIQSLLLGPHFGIEHQVRFTRGLFFNFNGTAGIWRRTAIESAGGWKSDTVTEDLDLSYRAQLAGWRFVYLDDVVVPSELPVTLSAFRSQQQRWAKGSVQTARKILPRILLAKSLPLALKLEAIAHLLANLGWLLGTIVTLTLYPAIISRVGIGSYQLLRFDLPLFLLASGAVLFYFCLYALAEKDGNPVRRLLLLPVLSIGLAPSLGLAVLEGMVSEGGNFKRTPKFGVHGRGPLPSLAFLYRQRALFHVAMNIALFVYSLLPVFFAWQRDTWMAIPFLMFFPIGFCLVILKDVVELT
jgi:cellulose synthase/poly-beta-1,6-N-acetylglucosamine synthase-like glycosyltransferase